MHENAQENVNSANNNGRKLVKHMYDFLLNLKF